MDCGSNNDTDTNDLLMAGIYPIIINGLKFYNRKLIKRYNILTPEEGVLQYRIQ